MLWPYSPENKGTARCIPPMNRPPMFNVVAKKQSSITCDSQCVRMSMAGVTVWSALLRPVLALRATRNGPKTAKS